MGEGEVRDRDGILRPAAEALRGAGIEPVELAEKEGLALINGTDGMLGMLVLALADLRRLLATADVAAAMSVEALLGTDAVFAADLQALRPHPGQAASAANLRALLAGSGDHGQPPRARVHPRAGRLLAALRARRCTAPRATPSTHAATVADRELAAAIDNPVVTARRPGGVQRQLPRRAGRLRARLPRDRRRRRRRDERAAHRPVPRRRPQPRAAAVPRRTTPASTPAT